VSRRHNQPTTTDFRAKLSKPYEPIAERDPSSRSRISDSVEKVFRRACAANEIETAKDLLRLMKSMARRDCLVFPDRRPTAEFLEKMSGLLEQTTRLSAALRS